MCLLVFICFLSLLVFIGLYLFYLSLFVIICLYIYLHLSSLGFILCLFVFNLSLFVWILSLFVISCFICRLCRTNPVDLNPVVLVRCKRVMIEGPLEALMRATVPLTPFSILNLNHDFELLNLNAEYRGPFGTGFWAGWGCVILRSPKEKY